MMRLPAWRTGARGQTDVSLAPWTPSHMHIHIHIHIHIQYLYLQTLEALQNFISSLICHTVVRVYRLPVTIHQCLEFEASRPCRTAQQFSPDRRGNLYIHSVL